MLQYRGTASSSVEEILHCRYCTISAELKFVGTAYGYDDIIESWFVCPNCKAAYSQRYNESVSCYTNLSPVNPQILIQTFDRMHHDNHATLTNQVQMMQINVNERLSKIEALDVQALKTWKDVLDFKLKS